MNEYDFDLVKKTVLEMLDLLKQRVKYNTDLPIFVPKDERIEYEILHFSAESVKQSCALWVYVFINLLPVDLNVTIRAWL